MEGEMGCVSSEHMINHVKWKYIDMQTRLTRGGVLNEKFEQILLWPG
jgi:hypothetical protein